MVSQHSYRSWKTTVQDPGRHLGGGQCHCSITQEDEAHVFKCLVVHLLSFRTACRGRVGEMACHVHLPEITVLSVSRKLMIT